MRQISSYSQHERTLMSFTNHLLSKRRVSVWGVGYLGYTTLLWLQSKGFMADVFIFEPDLIKPFQIGNYPLQVQSETWSSKGDIPTLDLDKISVAGDIKTMFQNYVHIISSPGKSETGNFNRLTELSQYFITNRDNTKTPLVIFQSAETPGDIQRYFIEPLQSEGCNYAIASAFRTDWSVEEFLFSNKQPVIAGVDDDSLEKTKIFFETLGIEYATLSSIKEAEIYEGARKTLQYTISSFVNQLPLAYPDTDIRKMTGLLTNDIQCTDIGPSIGAIGYKSVCATDHLIAGSVLPERLSLTRETGAANLSSILTYVDIIKRHSFISVTIMGISGKGDQKDIRLSPGLILAEGLIRQGVKVWIHDPYFTSRDIIDLFPNAAGHIDISKRPTDSPCIIMMTTHRMYRYFSQDDLDRLGITSAELVIDNTGLWNNISFSEDTTYHIPGDGQLEKLEG